MMHRKHVIFYTLVAYLLTACMLLAGCATVKASDPQDPFEGYNRAVFKFNMKFDKYIVRPTAECYNERVPGPIRKWVDNFLSNIDQIPTIANDILQLDLYHAVYNTWRLGINTTVGILGFCDVASKLGLTPKHTDFGITLAKWGIRKSPYFVIPFLGPSTTRDTIAWPLNYYFLTIYPHIHVGPRYALLNLYAINTRTKYLAADKLLDEAFDPYVLMRNAYLQKRRAEIDPDTIQEEDPYVEGNGDDEEAIDENNPRPTAAGIAADTRSLIHLLEPLPLFQGAYAMMGVKIPYKLPAERAPVHVPYRSI